MDFSFKTTTDILEGSWNIRAVDLKRAVLFGFSGYLIFTTPLLAFLSIKIFRQKTPFHAQITPAQSKMNIVEQKKAVQRSLLVNDAQNVLTAL